MQNITGLPVALDQKVESYLSERDQAKCKEVSKKVYQSSPELSPLQEVSKKRFESMQEELKCRKSYQEVQKKLDAHLKTWLGWVVSELSKKIDSIEIRLIRKICDSFLKYCFRKTVEVQKQLYQTLNDLSLKQRRLEMEISELCAKIEDLKAEQLIMDLFGGRKHFEKLPILDLNPLYEKYHKPDTVPHLDFMRSEDVPYPIMRGIDKVGRLFFTIKFTCDGQEYFHIFYQRHSKTTWYGNQNNNKQSPFFDNVSFIEEGKISKYKESMYKALHDLIITGNATYKRIDLEIEYSGNDRKCVEKTKTFDLVLSKSPESSTSSSSLMEEMD